MIEQSKRNGPVYYSEAGDKLISKKILAKKMIFR